MSKMCLDVSNLVCDNTIGDKMCPCTTCDVGCRLCPAYGCQKCAATEKQAPYA